MSEVKDELLSHDYDGIQEYDNPLPSWWVGMFFLTIIFAVFYIPYYATGMGASPEADYEADMQEWVKLHPPVNLASEGEMAELVKDPEQIAAGKKIFDEKCMACHAPDGGGLVGPNLTDAYWLHGGKPTEIAKTIFEGVPEKGMISWKTQMSLPEIYAATAYIKSLKGTTPATPKAPEGLKIDE